MFCVGWFGGGTLVLAKFKTLVAAEFCCALLEQEPINRGITVWHEDRIKSYD